MRINRKSWHFWIFKHLSAESCTYDSPSVCKYITVVAASPLAAVLVLALTPIVLLVAGLDKLVRVIGEHDLPRVKFKVPECPLGKVQFIPEKEPATHDH